MWKGAAALQLKALPLIEQLFCEVNPIPVKKAAQLMGSGSVDGLRMPLDRDVGKNMRQALAKAMADFGIQA